MAGYRNEIPYSITNQSRTGTGTLIHCILNHLALLRPSHWIKSLIAISIGPALMIELATLSNLLVLAGAIILFILASASIYVINDLADMQRDRQHPVKCQRPLASGAVVPKAALGMFSVLLVAMILLSTILPDLLILIVALYFACNLGYSFWLKHIPIIEMISVSTGFALRTIAGYVAFDVAPDHWIVVTVLAGSLLLTVGKRREELKSVNNPGEHRPVLSHYTEPLLNAYMLLFAALCFGAGLMSMHNIFDEKGIPVLFFASLPFFIYLLQRYLLIAFTKKETGNPTRLLLNDRIIHLALVAWISILGLGAATSHLVITQESVITTSERTLS